MIKLPLPDLTPDQTHWILMDAAFRMGILKAAEEDGKAVIHEMSRPAPEFYAETRAKGLLLPWSTHEWMVDELMRSRVEALAHS